MTNISLYILPSIICIILITAIFKKVPVYEEFVDGAKDGFKVSISIIPYLVAIIVGISMFKASGGIDLITSLMGGLLSKLSIPPDILPIMITRSLSGSATLGLFSDIAYNNGDCYLTKLAAVMVGSSETTFYVLSVYFGSVGIKKYRYSLLTGIIADITGIVLAIWVSRLFFLASI